MRTTMFASILALLVLGIAGAGMVAAHQTSGPDMENISADTYEHASMAEREAMHDEVERIADSGSYDELEHMRDRYNHHFMPGVESAQDFERMHHMDDGRQYAHHGGMGYHGGIAPCHR